MKDSFQNFFGGGWPQTPPPGARFLTGYQVALEPDRLVACK